MEKEEKEFHYTIGIYDTICKFIREKTREKSAEEGAYGIGVMTDELCEQKYMTHPLKDIEQRLAIARGLDGVDFVFAVDDLERVSEIAEETYLEFKKREEERKNKKQYKAGFIIGSFDLFHPGHLENIEIAREYCERLFVVLKTDERIIKNKKKTPQQPTAERAAILKSLRQIDDVLYMDIDSTREDVVQDVLRACPGIKRQEIVALFGSDLKEKEREHQEEWGSIKIVFTDRDPKKMEIVSSSHYQQEVIEQGGLTKFEDLEEEAFRE